MPRLIEKQGCKWDYSAFMLPIRLVREEDNVEKRETNTSKTKNSARCATTYHLVVVRVLTLVLFRTPARTVATALSINSASDISPGWRLSI